MPKQKLSGYVDLNSPRRELSSGGLESVVHNPSGSLAN